MSARILYFGSRTWTDANAIRAVMRADVDRFGDVLVIEGEANGADLISRLVAVELGLRYEPYPVEVAKDGPWPAAGHRRNERMAREGRPVEARAFVSGLRGEPHSKGSAGMLAILRRRGVPVVVHREDGIELPVHMARRVGPTCCPWHRSGGLAEVPCRATVSDDGGWNDGAAAQYVAHAKRGGGRS